MPITKNRLIPLDRSVDNSGGYDRSELPQGKLTGTFPGSDQGLIPLLGAESGPVTNIIQSPATPQTHIVVIQTAIADTGRWNRLLGRSVFA